MTAFDLAKTLIHAWRQDNEGRNPDQQEPGARTLKIISSALLQQNVQGMLRQALIAGLDPHHVALVNQEAERQAGIWLWDPDNTAKQDRECILLAFPAQGDLKALEAWMADPDHQALLEATTHRHLELLTGLDKENIQAVSIFPTLLHPALVASLTAESRRSILMEILGQGETQILSHLESQRLSVVQTEGKKVLGEGIILAAAVVRTDWGWHQSEAMQAVAEPHRVDDLAHGTMDEDFMAQAQHAWEQGLDELQSPGPAALLQPTSVNQALLSTLHSSLRNIRKYVLAENEPSISMEEWDLEDGPHVPILQIAVQEGENGHIMLDITTALAKTVVNIPSAWAFLEGEEAFRSILIDAMGLDEYDWKPDGEEEEPDPREVQGDHPAWKRAMPAPGGTH